MKIYVRRRHINGGKPNSSSGCPIALAIADVIDDDADVQPWYVNIAGEIIDLPESAHNFIERFDSGKPVKPFAFTIRA